MPFRSPKRTTLITLVCGAFLIGLWLAHVGVSVAGWALIPAALFLTISWRRASWTMALIIVAGLLGVLRGQVAVEQTKAIENLYGQKVQLIGTVSDDPVYTAKNYTEFSVQSQLPGEIKVRTHYIRLQRGYHVQVEGKLESTLGSKTAQIGFASAVQVTSMRQSWLEHVRQRFFAGMHTMLPEPLSSFGLGLLLGTRALIPKTLQDQLALVGLSHLVAVSGYNLTILTDVLRRLLVKASAFVRLVLPLWIMGGFLVLTGFSASVVRAAIVSVLSLLAAHYGRRFKPMVIIGLAAVATTLWRPSYLWSDLGWQLSFLAFIGILVVAPAVMRRISETPHPILALGTESLAAQIMTAPLIMAVFGTASLVAPLTNLVVLPLIPLAMLVSMVAGLGGMLLPSITVLAAPAHYLLQGIVSFIERVSNWQWASYPLHLQPVLLVAIYALIAVLVLLLKRRYNGRSNQSEEPDVRTFQMVDNQTQEGN